MGSHTQAHLLLDLPDLVIPISATLQEVKASSHLPGHLSGPIQTPV